MSPYDISWYCMFLRCRPLPNTLLTAPSGHNSSARLKWHTHFFSHHNIIHTDIIKTKQNPLQFFSCIALWSKGCHFQKSYCKMFNFESWFFCQFSSNTWFFLVEALNNTPKIGNKKNKVTYINLRACKTQKNVKGVFFTDKTGLKKICICYDICFYNFCEKHPLWVKNA